MAVLPMKRIELCAMKKDRKAILEYLQRRGDVEIKQTAVKKQDTVFARQDCTDAMNTFQKTAELAQNALSVLDRYAPAKKSMLAALSGQREMNLPDYETMVSKRDEIIQTARQLLSLEKEIAETAAEIPKTEAKRTALLPWKDYDLPLSMTGTKKTALFTGTVQYALTLEELYQKLAVLAPEVTAIDAEIISSSKMQSCVCLICERKDAETVENALRQMDFAKPPAAVSDETPAARAKALAEQVAALNKKLEQLRQEAASLGTTRAELEFAVDYYNMRAEKYAVIGKLAQSRRTFVLCGYVSAEAADDLAGALEKRFDLAVEFSAPDEKEDVPVLLKNNAFAAPVEPIVESYSLPGKHEIDPSFLVACFYYLLFGMMLSDAGYGLIMVIACGICLRKFKNMSAGLKKSMQMFFYSGISTMVFGFLYGSFFGDVVNVVATTFFNRPDITLPPLMFNPIDRPMLMMAICFGIGIVHLFFGLGAKLYMSIKAHKLADGIFDVVFWYMLVGGLAVYLLSTQMGVEMLGLSFMLPKIAGTIAISAAGLGALGIILTGGRESKNWGKRLMKGLYGVYGVTSYLSDILSYSRLLALGLATGVIAQVFNKMGSMFGGGVVGAIAFTIVFVIGHTLNLGINALGAYVHTNRLEYVEFFGKFYEGGGRKFTPFTEHTKFYKIKEEQKNG